MTIVQTLDDWGRRHFGWVLVGVILLQLAALVSLVAEIGQPLTLYEGF